MAESARRKTWARAQRRPSPPCATPALGSRARPPPFTPLGHLLLLLLLLPLLLSWPGGAQAQTQTRPCSTQTLLFHPTRQSGAELYHIVEDGRPATVRHGGVYNLSAFCETGANLLASLWQCNDGEWQIVQQPAVSWCEGFEHCTLSADGRALTCDGLQRAGGARGSGVLEVVPPMLGKHVEELAIVNDRSLAYANPLTGDRLRVLNISNTRTRYLELTYFLKLEVLDASNTDINNLAYSQMPFYHRMRRVELGQRTPQLLLYPKVFGAMSGCGLAAPPVLNVGQISPASHVSGCRVDAVESQPDCYRVHCPSGWKPTMRCPPSPPGSDAIPPPAGGSWPEVIEARLLCDGIPDCAGASDEGPICTGLQMTYRPDVHVNSDEYCAVFVPCLQEVVVSVRAGVISVQAGRSTLYAAGSCRSLLYVGLYRTSGWFEGFRYVDGRQLISSAMLVPETDEVDIRLQNSADVQFNCRFRLKVVANLTRDAYIEQGIAALYENRPPEVATSTSSMPATSTAPVSATPLLASEPAETLSPATQATAIGAAAGVAVLALVVVVVVMRRRRRHHRRVAANLQQLLTPAAWLEKVKAGERGEGGG